MKRCLIIGAAEIRSPNAVKRFIGKDDFVICADGGYDNAKKLGILTDVLVGDFDSFTGKLPDNIPIVRFPSEKDSTDMFLAVEEAIRRGYLNITILGGIGSRVDHTFANLQLLAYFKKKGVDIFLASENNLVFFLKTGKHTLKKDIFPNVSFFSFMGDIKGITLDGFKYPLNKYHMKQDDSIGISNLISGESATVTFTGENLLVVRSCDSAELNR